MKLSVKQKLLLSYLLIGVPLSLFVIYTSYQRYQNTKTQSYNRNFRQNDLIQNNIASKIKEVVSLQSFIAEDLKQNYKNSNASQISSVIMQRAKAFNKQDIYRVDYISSDNRMVQMYDEDAHNKMVPNHLSHWIKANPKLDNLIMDFHINNDQPGFCIIKKLIINSGGYIHTKLNPSRLFNDFKYVDNNHLIILSNSMGHSAIIYPREKAAIIRNFPKNQPGKPWQTTISGQKYIVFSKPFPTASFKVNLLQPAKPFFGPAQEEANNSYFFFLGLFLTVVLSVISGARITKPLDRLRSYVENLTNLNFETNKPIRTGDEFELFFTKFNQMNIRLKKYTRSFERKNKELQAIINNMQSGVIISNDQGNITNINKTASEILKFDIQKYYTEFLSCLHEISGEPITAKTSPVQRTLKGQQFSNYLLEYRHPEINNKCILNFCGTPLKNGENHIYGSVLIFLDVSEQQHLQEKLKRKVSSERIKTSHLSVLHDVSLKLNQEKDVNKILNTVIKAAAMISEAKSGILLQQDYDGFTIASDYNFNASNKKVSLTKIRKYLGQEMTKKLFSDKKCLNISDFSRSIKKNDFINSNTSIKAMLVTPIIDKKQNIVGILALFNKKKTDKRFTLEDEKVTQILSAHATVAIANATSYKREHHIAHVLQKSLLPSSTLAKSLNPNLDISLVYKPATKEHLVGGDFYDFFEITKQKTACLIADVNGKGVEAAAITSLAKSTIMAFAYENFSADKVLEKTNKVLVNQTEPAVFITAIFGILDLKTGIFEYANAGHHPPLLYRYKQNGVLCLEQGSTPLGIMPSEHYDLHIIDIQANDCLALYTDGLVEARSNNQLYGEKRLIKSLLSHATFSDIAEKMLSDVEQFAEGNLSDDVALVALRLKNELNMASRESRVSVWS